MNRLPCTYRIPLPHLRGQDFCAHPKVHFRDGILFENACSVCESRSTELPVSMRTLPRQLRDLQDISPCCFLHDPCDGGVANRCLHPSYEVASPEICRMCNDYRPRPQRGSVRQWAIGMTTASRTEPTRARTMRSLDAAGWQSQGVHVFAEPDVLLMQGEEYSGALTRRGKTAGAFANWYLALQELVLTQPDADAYVIFQDDVICCRDLRGYLEKSLWPEAVTGLVSLYCGMLQSGIGSEPGFQKIDPGNMLYGALAVAFPPGAARAILLHPGFLRHRESRNGTHGIDLALAEWMNSSGLPGFVHTPSLVDHIGQISSIFRSVRDGPERRTDSFVGEEASAIALFLKTVPAARVDRS